MSDADDFDPLDFSDVIIPIPDFTGSSDEDDGFLGDEACTVVISDEVEALKIHDTGLTKAGTQYAS